MDGKEISLTMVEKGANPGIQRKAKHPNGVTLHRSRWRARGIVGCCKDKAPVNTWKEKRIEVTGVWRSMKAEGML